MEITIPESTVDVEVDIDYSDLANEIDYTQLGSEIDYGSLTSELDYSEISFSEEETNAIADRVMETSRQELEDALFEKIENDTDLLKQVADLVVTRLLEQKKEAQAKVEQIASVLETVAAPSADQVPQA